jgi:hypothetical protein
MTPRKASRFRRSTLRTLRAVEPFRPAPGASLIR